MALDMVLNGVEWTLKQQESRDVSIGHIDLHLKLEFDPENNLCLKESSLPPFFFLGDGNMFFADEMEHQ